MILVFLGPPGSGKGTQAKLLAEKLGIPHISLGDVLREEVRQGTAIGKRAGEFMNAGRLVPDELTIELTRQRIGQLDCIIDGFPRSAVQAEAFDKMLKEIGRQMDAVIYFKVDEDKVVERLSGRRSCKQCGAVYHVRFKAPKAEGKCDVCGGELFQRPDDEEKAIRTRFEVYAQQTEPLIERYRKAGILRTLDASGSIEEIFGALLKTIGHGRDKT